MKSIKRVLAVVLCFAMFVGLCNFSNLEVRAASKPTLEDSSKTISLGKEEYNNIVIYDKIKGATYTYTSSNSKIVKISKKGELTGIKAGKAKITVYQNLKGKKTKIGTCNIVVKASSLSTDEYSINYTTNSMEGDNAFFYNLNYWDLINYRPSGAKYTYTSSDTGLVKINKDGQISEIGQPGKQVTITVKETFNKKTRTVGKLKLSILTPTINQDEIEIGINTGFYPYEYMSGYNGGYYIICSDQAEPLTDNSTVIDVKDDYDDSNDILRFNKVDGYWYGELIAQKEGVVYVHCYMGSSSSDISKENLIGTLKVNVKEYKTTSLSWDEESISDNEQNGILTVEYDEYDNYCNLYYTYKPDNSTDTPVITSSNTSVATVSEYSYTGKISLDIHSEGTTKITLKMGDYTIEKTINFVKSN